jgi:hypothetical protein
MVSALGISRGSSAQSGGDRLAKFVSGQRVSPYITDGILSVTTNPIKFRAVLWRKRHKGWAMSRAARVALLCGVAAAGFLHAQPIFWGIAFARDKAPGEKSC